MDTGPILEKPIAEAAGIGWQGKSTIIIEKEYGTWSFLGTIVTTLDVTNNLKPKDPVAMGLINQKDLILALEKAERRIKREKKIKEKSNLSTNNNQ